MNRSNANQYVQFRIDEDCFAIHISDIHEIIKPQEISKIPDTKPHIKGVINLRGQIIPVISLRILFGLTDEPFTKSSRIIVTQDNNEKIGLIVDRVDKVTIFDDIQPPPDRIGAIHEANFTGVGVLGDNIVGILNLDQVMLR